MPDELNRGLESDRLEVDWALQSPRVAAAAAGTPHERSWEGAPRALAAVPHLAGVAPTEPRLHLGEPVVLLEVPTDFPAIRRRDRGLTHAWRVASREAFLHYFSRGYRTIDFILRTGDGLRGDYVLTRSPDDD
jgi:predicted GNAT superfamily acetyltransferase